MKAETTQFIHSGRSAILTTLVLAALVVYIVRVALPAARANTGGFATAYTSAYILAHNPQDMEHIYVDSWFAAQIPRVGIEKVHDIFYINPPTMSLILFPLVGLPPQSARLVWIFMCLLLLLSGLILLAYAFDLSPRWGVWGMPACLLYAPVTENIRIAYVYMLLFFLLCLVFWALGRPGQKMNPPHEGSAIAGTALGLMLVLKTATLWLWPLLLLTGRWRVLLWAAGVAASVALVSMPLIGLKPWLTYMTLLPDLATTSTRYVTAYQTVTSLSGHLLVYNAKWNPTPVVDWPIGAPILNLVVLLVTLIFSVRWGRFNDTRHEVRALTLALFMALIVANAPIGESYHHTLTLPSLLVACWWAWRGKLGWGALGVLALAAFLLGAPRLPYKSPRLMVDWLALLAYPRVYGAYILWGWLGWVLCASRSRMDAPLLCGASMMSQEDEQTWITRNHR